MDDDDDPSSIGPSHNSLTNGFTNLPVAGAVAIRQQNRLPVKRLLTKGSVSVGESVLSNSSEEDQSVAHDNYNDWNNALHSNPGVQYVGICKRDSDRRFHINSARNLKRKLEVTNSCMSPSRKQHITEEKMAACMQGLSLENHQQLRGAVKNINDDSDFEDDSDLDDESIEEKCLDPVFELHVDLKDHLKKFTSLLPDSIVEDITKGDNTNLAVVPYVPRDSLFLRSSEIQPEEVIASSKPQADDTQGESCKSSIDMFVADWNSDSDNDFMLE